MDGGALKGGKVLDIEATVFGAARNDDRTSADALGIGKSDDKTLVRSVVSLQMRNLVGNRHFGSEFLRLRVSTAHQRAARDPGRKTEIILDPRRGAGLASERVAIQYQNRKSLGRGIDGRRQTGRSRADNRDVIKLGGVERLDEADTPGKSDLARVAKHLPVRAQHDGKLEGLDMKAFKQGLCLRVGVGIESLTGMAIACQESLQPKDIAIVGTADDNRAANARFKQTDAAQDEGAHDALAQLGLFHQKVRDPVRGNYQCLHRRFGYGVHQSRPARKLGKLAPKGTWAIGDDGIMRLGVVALRDDDLARKDEEHARPNFAGLRQIFAGSVRMFLAKTAEPFHIRLLQDRERLFATGLEYRNLR